MFHRILFSLLLLWLPASLSAHADRKERSIPYPNFTSSVLYHGAYDNFNRYQHLYSSFDPECVDLFEAIYYLQIDSAHRNSFSEKARIPKIIHQIWLGGDPPEICREWMSSWANLHGWEYKLWTEEDVKTLKLYNRDLYDSIDNLGEKSDILRLEILYQFGGVYVDVDLACMKPEYMEELHTDFDFYICIEPLGHGAIYKYHMYKFCNAIIGSAPKHTLVETLITNLKANYFAYLHLGVVERTGPSYITRIIYEYEARGAHKQRNIYLPTTLFYPIAIFQREDSLAFPERYIDLFPETAAIHYWMGSWRPTTLNYPIHSDRKEQSLREGVHE